MDYSAAVSDPCWFHQSFVPAFHNWSSCTPNFPLERQPPFFPSSRQRPTLAEHPPVAGEATLVPRPGPRTTPRPLSPDNAADQMSGDGTMRLIASSSWPRTVRPEDADAVAPYYRSSASTDGRSDVNASESWAGSRNTRQQEPARRSRSSDERQAGSSSSQLIRRTRSPVTRHPHIDNGAAMQTQMYSSFLQLHFGSPGAQADLIARRSYLLGVPDIDHFSKPLLRHAVLTVCYAHLGRTNGNKHMIRQSQSHYGHVLRALSQELSKRPEQQDPQAIISSILLLTLYDDALPAPQSLSSGWVAHFEGVQSYIRVKGPSSLDTSSPWSRLLFINLRVPALFIGMAKRKAVTMGQPEFVEMMRYDRDKDRPRVALYDMTLGIPALLERVEDAIQGDFDEQNTVSLCGEIVSLQKELHRWFANELPGVSPGDLERDVVHVSDIDRFDMSVEEHLFMTTNPTFTSFYRMSAAPHKDEAVWYWQYCLILDCALLRILHFLPEMSNHIGPELEDSLRKDAFLQASSLCRSIYYLSMSPRQGFAMYCQFVGTFAKNFFEEVGAVKEVGWCHAVGIATQLRLARLRATQPRSLCRMGALVQDVASLASYRSREISTASEASRDATTPSSSTSGTVIHGHG